ncbi:MAG TPA: hypothetical protein VFD76_11050, partial [Gemmatimonadales bacterium]|nr:hypothetical protein [Gemmatimonadales bacterium]
GGGGGGGGGGAGFDWCDRLQALAGGRDARSVRAGSYAGVAASQRAVVLVIRLAGHAEALLITEDGARADPVRATALLERAAVAEGVSLDRAALDEAIRRAAPLVRSRLAAVEDARWRAADRNRLSRRLIPWVLTAARRAAACRRHSELGRLDALVSRLALGMTAGEELRLEDLITRRAALSVGDVLAWHEQLPPVRASEAGAGPRVELVAGLVFG